MSSPVDPQATAGAAQRDKPAAHPQAVPPRQLWWLAAGFGAWCSALVALYALHAIGCAFAWPSTSLRVSLVAVFLAHLAAIGWMWGHAARARPDARSGPVGSFLHAAIVWTTIVAFVATVLTLGPPLLLSTCH